MPAAWDEFTAAELAWALGESRGHADGLLTCAQALETRLPGTRAALRDGTITRYKAEIIMYATALLDPAEAGAAEALVLGRAGRLTPGGLRAAIARAVMQVAPDKARKRREAAARDARVQRWAEDSGNAALMGRELPPAEVLAADQRITDPDRPAHHPDRPGRAAGGDPRHRPGRSRPGPRPGPRRRAEPEDDVVRDRDRRAQARRRPRVRPARSQESQEAGGTSTPGRTRKPGRAGVHLHRHLHRRARATWRIRDLAAAHPGTGAGPDRHAVLGRHRRLRSPVRHPRS